MSIITVINFDWVDDLSSKDIKILFNIMTPDTGFTASGLGMESTYLSVSEYYNFKYDRVTPSLDISSCLGTSWKSAGIILILRNRTFADIYSHLSIDVQWIELEYDLWDDLRDDLNPIDHYIEPEGDDDRYDRDDLYSDFHTMVLIYKSREYASELTWEDINDYDWIDRVTTLFSDLSDFTDMILKICSDDVVGCLSIGHSTF